MKGYLRSDGRKGIRNIVAVAYLGNALTTSDAKSLPDSSTRMFT